MKNFGLLIGFLVCTISACESDNNPEEKEKTALNVTIDSVLDDSNNGNGSDISVRFTSQTSRVSEITEYRIIVLNTEQHNGLTVAEASEIATGRYHALSGNTPRGYVSLPENLLDSDGNSIIESREYQVYVFTVVSPDNDTYTGGISSPVSITLTRTNLVETLATGFSASGGIRVGPDGSIYVANFGTGDENGTKILKFSGDDFSHTEFADGLLGPTSGAFDSQGNLFWSSYSAGKVHKIDANGTVTDFVNIPGPVAINTDDQDNLFIASCDNNEIYKVTPAGVATVFATSSDFACPNGLSIAPSGDIYTCNYETGQVFKITSTGEVSTFATIPSLSSVHVLATEDILYVLAQKAHRLYAISLDDGSVEVLAGTGERGNKDGAALNAELSLPNGLAISADGTKLYFADVVPDSGTNANGPNYNPNVLRVLKLEADN